MTSKLPSNKAIEKQVKQELLYPEIIVQGGYIGSKRHNKKENTWEFKKIGKAIIIDKVRTNIDTGELTFDISFKYGGKTVETTLSRGELTKTKILRLAAQGADVFDHNAADVIKHICNQEILAPTVNVHQQLGWGIFKDQVVFKHFKAIGVDSDYVGNMTIEPKGTFSNWKQMVETEVLGHVPLETALVFGLSSVVVGFINEELAFGCLITHFSGNSTEGKTTACQLAISTAGYPDTKKTGLMSTWNSTLNATMGVLRDNNGLPVLLDESSMSSAKDFSNIIYVLAGGKEKGRMNKELELRDAATWNTTILSNGEHSLTVKAKQNAGIKMRLIEFSGVGWTKSAENAEAIKANVLENYGHAAPMLADYLLKKGKKATLKSYEQWRNKCLQALGDTDKFAARIAIKLGILMTSAEAAKECLGLELDLIGILDFLVENEKQSVTGRDLYSTAYNHILEQVDIHRKKFDKDYGTVTKDVSLDLEAASYEQWGKIEHKDDRVEISIAPSIFRKLLLEGGFEDPIIILKEWKRQGLLSCEVDRFTRKRKLTKAGSTIEVYVLIIPTEKVEKETLLRKKLPKKIRSKTIDL